MTAGAQEARGGGAGGCGADLAVAIGGLALKNPVLTASGTHGYGHDIQPVAAMAQLGGVVTKGLSLRPRDGNPPPRLFETHGGMLNSIGLANMGVERFLREALPALRGAGVTVIANIFGESEEEFEELARMLGGGEGIGALELNVSCPNVKKGGVLFGKDPGAAARMTEAVVKRAAVPVIVKLTPEAGVLEVARAVEGAGAAGVTAANTFRGMAIDPETGRPRLGALFGGLSGPAIKPIVLRIVYELSQALIVPVIASGGIMSATDAVEYLMAGATAVEVGTASFLDPAAPFTILRGVAEYCARKGVAARDLVGLTHRIVGGG